MTRLQASPGHGKPFHHALLITSIVGSQQVDWLRTLLRTTRATHPSKKWQEQKRNSQEWHFAHNWKHISRLSQKKGPAARHTIRLLDRA
jgi:hypothetical protein